MAAKVEHAPIVEKQQSQTTSVAGSLVKAAANTKPVKRTAKVGVNFVIPKNKLSGALVPVNRGRGKLGTDDSKKDSEIKLPQRKTKWGFDLSQDTFVKKGRALAYQTRVEQITAQLESGNLEEDLDEYTRSPSPPPECDASGQQINTREARWREQLELERREAIGECIRLNPNYKPPVGYVPIYKEAKFYIPVKEYPGFNFVGLISGPEGKTRKRLEDETGTKILIKGEVKDIQGRVQTIDLTDSKVECSKDDLYVHISADTYEKVDAAIAFLEMLITSVEGNIPSQTATTSGETLKTTDQSSQMTSASISGLSYSFTQSHSQTTLLPSPVQQTAQNIWSSQPPTAVASVNNQSPYGQWQPAALNSTAPNQSPFQSMPNPNQHISQNASMPFSRASLPTFASFPQPPFGQGRPPFSGPASNAFVTNFRNSMPSQVNGPNQTFQPKQRPFLPVPRMQNQSAFMRPASVPMPQQAQHFQRGGSAPPFQPPPNLVACGFRPSGSAPFPSVTLSTSMNSAVQPFSSYPQGQNFSSPNIQIPNASQIRSGGQQHSIPSPQQRMTNALHAPSPAVSQGMQSSGPDIATSIPLPLGLPGNKGPQMQTELRMPSPGTPLSGMQGVHNVVSSSTAVPPAMPQHSSPALPPVAPVPPPPRISSAAISSPFPPQVTPSTSSIATSPSPAGNPFSSQTPRVPLPSQGSYGPPPSAAPIPVMSAQPGATTNLVTVQTGTLPAAQSNPFVGTPTLSQVSTSVSDMQVQGTNTPTLSSGARQLQPLSSGDFTFQPQRPQTAPQAVWPQSPQIRRPDVNHGNYVRPGDHQVGSNIPQPALAQIRSNAPPPPHTLISGSPPVPSMSSQPPSFRPPMSSPSRPLVISSQPAFPDHSQQGSGSQASAAVISPRPPFMGASQPPLLRPSHGPSNFSGPQSFNSSQSQPQPRPNIGLQNFSSAVPAFQHALQPGIPPPGGMMIPNAPTIPMSQRAINSSNPGVASGVMQPPKGPVMFHNNVQLNQPPNPLQHLPSSVRPMPGQSLGQTFAHSSMNFAYQGSNTLPNSKVENSSSQSYDPFSPTAIAGEKQNSKDPTVTPKSDTEYEKLMESVGVK